MLQHSAKCSARVITEYAGSSEGYVNMHVAAKSGDHTHPKKESRKVKNEKKKI